MGSDVFFTKVWWSYLSKALVAIFDSYFNILNDQRHISLPNIEYFSRQGFHKNLNGVWAVIFFLQRYGGHICNGRISASCKCFK